MIHDSSNKGVFSDILTIAQIPAVQQNEPPTESEKSFYSTCSFQILASTSKRNR